MKNNLPQKYEGNFFVRLMKKIKNFIKKCESNDCIEKNKINNEENKPILNDIKNATDKNVKNNYTIKKERENFLKKLIENPELLEHFSNDKLEIILEEYKKSNKYKRIKLKKYMQ